MQARIVSQKLASAIIEIFLSEGWLQLLYALDSERNREFATEIAQGVALLAKEQDSMLKFLADTDLKPVAEAWLQVARFCRGLLVAMDVKSQSGGLGLELKSSDLLYFSQYTDPALYDRSMRMMIEKQEWWQTKVEEVVRLASAELVIGPQMAKLEALLGEGSDLSATGLRDVAQLFTAVKQNIRESDLASLTQRTTAVITAKAEQLMHLGDLTKVDGGMCDALIELMTTFSAVPGVPSVKAEFSEWYSHAEASVQYGRVLSLLSSADAEKVEFEQVKQMLEKIPGTLWSSNRKNPDLITGALNFLDKGCRQIVHQAASPKKLCI